MATTITRTGGDTVIARTGLTDITITSTTDVEITYNAEELWINILVLGANDPPIALEVADITTVNGVDVTAYTIEQLVQYIADNCFGIISEINENLTINGVTTPLTINSSTAFTTLRIDNQTANAAYRNWAIANSANNSGDFSLFVSSAQGLNPISGILVFNISSAGVISLPTIPTSSAGLAAGSVWSDGGTLKIV